MLKGMGMRRVFLVAVLAGAFVVGALGASGAFGSVLLARSAKDVRLKITGGGKALVKYKRNGKRNYILAWGAINARAHPKCGRLQGPLCGPPQVNMKHRRVFPGGRKGRTIINGPNHCKRYDGPKLAFVVAACKAPDGTYWVLQAWVRLGRVCTRANAGPKELRISHFSGPVAKLHLFLDWHTPHPHVPNPVHFDHLFGWYDYKHQPVFGLRWDAQGVPLDGYGRVIYMHSRNARCGKGWRHNESGLSKPIHGQTCHTYGPAGSRRWLSTGDMYKATAMGPGVTPDVTWGPVPALTVFDPIWELTANELQEKLARGSKFCNRIH